MILVRDVDSVKMSHSVHILTPRSNYFLTILGRIIRVQCFK